MGNVASQVICSIVSAIVAPIAAPAILALGPAGPIAGGIVVGIQAIMGTVAAGNAIAAVARGVADRRAIPAASTTLDAATDVDRPPAHKSTGSKEK